MNRRGFLGGLLALPIVKKFPLRIENTKIHSHIVASTSSVVHYNSGDGFNISPVGYFTREETFFRDKK